MRRLVASGAVVASIRPDELRILSQRIGLAPLAIEVDAHAKDKEQGPKVGQVRVPRQLFVLDETQGVPHDLLHEAPVFNQSGLFPHQNKIARFQQQ